MGHKKTNTVRPTSPPGSPRSALNKKLHILECSKEGSCRLDPLKVCRGLRECVPVYTPGCTGARVHGCTGSKSRASRPVQMGHKKTNTVRPTSPPGSPRSALNKKLHTLECSKEGSCRLDPLKACRGLRECVPVYTPGCTGARVHGSTGARVQSHVPRGPSKWGIKNQYRAPN